MRAEKWHMLALVLLGQGRALPHVSPRSPRRDMSDVNVTIPSEYDFLKEYPACDFGPLSQECGCCYAYGPIKAMSHRFCRITGRQILLSSQFVVSCDLADNACVGGCERTVLYFMEQHGISDVQCHPWRGQREYRRDFCTRCADGAPVRLYRAVYGSTAHYVGIENIKKAILTEGPLTASIAVDSRFSSYGSGVYTSTLRPPIEAGNHAVEIVGWGVEKGREYWILLNQYGRRWGKDGRMKIKMGTNEGLVESFMYGATPLIESD